MKNHVITISREFGSGGHTIGKKAAEQLGIPCYDAELIHQIAQESGFTEGYIKEAGEYAPSGFLSSAFADRFFGPTNEDYLWNIQYQVITELAEKGPCVIVGRCADYILQDKADCLKVFSLVKRIQHHFPELRASFSAVTTEPRLVDAGALLTLTGEILLDYGVACGAISRNVSAEYLPGWQAIILGMLSFTSSIAKEVDLASLCREALNTAQEAGTLRVATTVDDFQPGMDGFLSADRLWLRSEALLREMRRKSTEMAAACTLSAKEVLPELFSKGLILRDEEEGKHSYLKKTPTIPALGKRTRMVCFDRNELNTQS